MVEMTAHLTRFTAAPFDKLPLLLFGDFNDRCLRWGDSHCNSELKLNFVNLLLEFNMTQMISTPTRGKHILDLLITNHPLFVSSVKIEESFDGLDHRMIIASCACKSVSSLNYYRTVSLFTDENLAALNYAISNVPWHSILEIDDDIDDMVANFYSVLNAEIAHCIPSKRIKIRPADKPGMTLEVR